MDLFSYQLSEGFWSWLGDFRPGVVYSCFGSIRIMRLSFQIAAQFDLPIVPHFMDDWPTTIYDNAALSFLLRPKLKSWLKRCLERSRVRLAIGETMAEEFGRRYGAPFRPFMNCVEDEWLDRPLVEPVPRSVVRFAYVGGLHLNRWKSLYDIGLALKHLRAKGVLGELVIYGKGAGDRHMERLSELGPVVRMAGAVSVEEVPAIQEDADCLIHVESFEPADRRYTRLSVSTKIPGYLASGRPILAYGPGETASVRYVEETGCGRVVGQRNDSLLAEALTAVIGSRSLRLEFGRRAKVLAGTAHRASQIREEFRSILRDAADCRTP
jgi:glycosyltransferase involved in cell wall biosynthesis